MPGPGRLLSGAGWAAVLGSPVGHSLSPALHRAAHAALGTGWMYTAVECDRARLPALLAAARSDPGFGGYSLTMPLKEAAVPLLDEVRTELGAVNTVVPLPGGGLAGHNTDVAGVAAALAEVRARPGPAAVLGAGGTARAAVAALRAAARSVTVAARRPAAAGALGCAVVRFHDFDPTPYAVVVATTPAGATDGLAGKGWPAGTALVDVVYVPWPTPLAAAAAAVGAPVAGGLAVLVGQAVEQVALMTGTRPDPAVLREAGERALAARSQAPNSSGLARRGPTTRR